MPDIINTVIDAAGRPIQNVQVSIALVGNWSADGDKKLIKTSSWFGRTDENGTWKISLPPNSEYEGDTYYVVREGSNATLTFTVADSPNEQRLRDRLMAPVPPATAEGLSLDDLTDVSTSGATPGQVPTYNGTLWIPQTPESNEAGVTDHTNLTGLSNDDHLQYLTTDRGDARYYTQSELDVELNSLSSDVDGKSPLGHTHGYSELGHTHDYLTQATASNLYAPIASVRPTLFKRKTSDESLAANIIPQADDELFIDITDGSLSVYKFEGFLIFDSPSGADIDIHFTIPPSAELEWSPLAASTTTTSYVGSVKTGVLSGTANEDFGGVAVGTKGSIRIDGTLITTQSGTLQLMWAQNTSDPGATTVRKNSWLCLTKMN